VNICDWIGLDWIGYEKTICTNDELDVVLCLLPLADRSRSPLFAQNKGTVPDVVIVNSHHHDIISLHHLLHRTLGRYGGGCWRGFMLYVIIVQHDSRVS